jgi:hypothetical protein
MVQNTKRRRRKRLTIINLVMFGLLLLATGLLYLWKGHMDQKSVVPTQKTAKAEILVWIWKVEDAKKATGGSLESIVAKCQDNGVAGLIVCSIRGDEWFNDRQEVERLGNLADKAGLAYFTYGRFMAGDVVSEENRAIEAITDNPDGFVFDLESEYKTTKGADKAEALVSNVRRWCESNSPDTLLSYTSYGIPSLHKTFPWEKMEEFELCMPQWYATSMQKSMGWTYTDTLKRIKNEFKNIQMPYAPVIQAYGEDKAEVYVSPDELSAMLKFSNEMEFTTFISIFRLELMDDEHWRVIREYTGAKRQDKKARDRLDSRSLFYFRSILFTLFQKTSSPFWLFLAQLQLERYPLSPRFSWPSLPHKLARFSSRDMALVQYMGNPSQSSSNQEEFS